MALKEEYERRYSGVLVDLAVAIEAQLKDYLVGEARIDRVQARAKSPDRFLAKASKIIEGGVQKYSAPLYQIQDQVGARVVVFYLSDVERISEIIERYFRPVEARDLVPESELEFSYFGRHYVLFVEQESVDSGWEKGDVPEFFELQIKTLFQHAWSEAEHDLGYKTGSQPLSSDQKRKMAFTSAQAWGADQIFEELFIARAAAGC